MDYELLDCGDGERLERFGQTLCRRLCPTAVWKKHAPSEIWQSAALIFDNQKWQGEPLRDWRFNFIPRGSDRTPRGFSLELFTGEHGQIGIFPEQISNWQWLIDLITSAPRRLSILNLFAYTGGATLACALAGAQVCHLDAAAAVVSRARKNAEISGLTKSPIRWLVDDCRKFLRREIRRQNFYDALILDPPAFGRAGKNTWKLTADLPELLALSQSVLSPTPHFILFSCHTPDFNPQILAKFFPAVQQWENIALVNHGQYNDLPLGQAWRGIF